jgi:hypothetical protein
MSAAKSSTGPQLFGTKGRQTDQNPSIMMKESQIKIEVQTTPQIPE